MANSNLKIGDVLPADMQSDYSEEVLNVTIEEALQIAKYSMPPTSNLSKSDVDSINEIYQMYLSHHADKSGSAYWDKTPDQNEAYWSSK